LNISIQAFQFKHLIKKDSDETFQIRHFRWDISD
jgi:RNase adaptor protein for sRNA GlmZ degradation